MRSFWRATRWLAIAMAVACTAPLAVSADEVEAEAEKGGSLRQDKQPLPREVLERGRKKREAMGARKAEREAEWREKRAARRAAGGNQDGDPSVPHALWWNEPAIVQELGLTAGIRKQFDAELEQANAKELERSVLQESMRGYHEAIQNGDWSAAKRYVAKRLEYVRRPIEIESNLKMNVLAKLSDEQLKKLKEDYHAVFVSKWVPRTRWGKKPPVTPAKKVSGPKNQ